MDSPADSISRRIRAAVLGKWRSLPLAGQSAESAHHDGDSSAPGTSGRKRRAAKLSSTFFLARPADEALAALENLGLGRFALEFVTIPAQGGCVVAVFAPPESGAMSRLRRAREQHDVVVLLRSIGATAVP